MALLVTNGSPHATLDNVPNAIWDPSTRLYVSFLWPIRCKATMMMMTVLRKQTPSKKMDMLGQDCALCPR